MTKGDLASAVESAAHDAHEAVPRPASAVPADRPAIFADPEGEAEPERERLARVALLEVAELSCGSARRLIARFGSARAAWARRVESWDLPGAQPVAEGAALERASRSLAEHAARGVQVLAPGSAGFPAWLAVIPDPPILLYARGPFVEQPALAIVGSRHATTRARTAAHDMAAEVAKHGIAIVSGLAYGVDAAAHRGALDAGGVTWAVLASGIDCPSPEGNRPLADEILRGGGAWLSEHAPRTTPRPGYFPERNRLISGLARATLVAEARERSGSLWTAQHALEQGRDVLVIPGPIDTDACRGSNRLLREGAAVVLEPADLIDAVRPELRASRAAALAFPADPRAAPVLDRLRDGPVALDTLAAELSLDPPALAQLVLPLELDGFVTREGSLLSLKAKGASTRLG